MRNSILSIFVLCLLGIGSCSPNLPNLSAFKVKDWQGKEVDWKKYEGKTLFVHFWGTWCKDCLKEMPFLVQTKEDLGVDSAKVAFVFISDEDTATVIPFVKERGFHFEFVQLQGTLKESNIVSVPQTYIFDKTGKPVASFGSRKWSAEELRSMMD